MLAGNVNVPNERTPLKEHSSTTGKDTRSYTSISPLASPRAIEQLKGVDTDNVDFTQFRSEYLVKLNERPKPPMTVMDHVWNAIHITRKVVVMTMLFFVALMMNVFQVINVILFYWTYRKLYRLGCEVTDYFYGGFLVSILETMSGIDLYFYGDPNYFEPVLPDGSRLDKVILISNHTSYADWVIFFSAAYRRRANQLLRIFLKDVAAYIPGIGWATYLSDYFLVKKSRDRGNWQKDGQVIVDRLKNFKETDSRIWAAIFPEGTFHDRAIPDLVEKNRKFSQENGLPVLTYLLNPFPRGITSCIQNLRGHATHVVDLTLTLTGNADPSPQAVQYVGALPLEDPARVLPDASDGTSFRGPRAAHIHVRLHDMQDVPDDANEIRKWMSGVWQEKEKLLEYFSEHGKFPGPAYKSKSYMFWGEGKYAQNWMIRFPIFWAFVTYLFYRIASQLPTLYIQYGTIICIVVSVTGIVIQKVCKPR